jgi:hypothetical protein
LLNPRYFTFGFCGEPGVGLPGTAFAGAAPGLGAETGFGGCVGFAGWLGLAG